MYKEIFSNFTNPSSEYRGAPFWAWNGKIEQDELRHQINIMHEMGLGGFFMHARIGLATDYLSNEWFDCVRACVDEADKLGMRPWLYDEDRWPSGAGGGKVTCNPEYRARSLVVAELKNLENFNASEDTLGLYTAKMNGAHASDLQKLSKLPEKLDPEYTLLHFYRKTDECSAWYNGQTYLDTLNEDAVKEFIKTTHQAYHRETGEKFGKLIPGFFTDEPNFGHICTEVDKNKTTIPWTDKLAEVFASRYGYDIEEHLPDFFYDIEEIDSCKSRIDYVDCLNYLFVNAYIKQIGNWCEEHDLMLTGHILAEDTLSSQTEVAGSVMRAYEYMQMPGMDLLTEHFRMYDTAKQVSSVGRQFDRKWRLSEMYAVSGWDFPLAGHKALGDWQIALGINYRCQHLAWYTMEGEAKRDCPASISYQSPWWKEYSKVEDYFARINLVMTQGKEVRNLLVIHPVESMWTKIRKGWKKDSSVQKMDSDLIKLRDCILKANIDFDYGDESILGRHGRVETQNSSPVLKIGQAEYNSVVVPAMLTIRSSTLKLLQEFKDAGGSVVFNGKSPEYVDGIKSNIARVFAEKCIRTQTGSSLISNIESNVRCVSIITPEKQQIEQALHLLREDEENSYLFICNTGHENLPEGTYHDKSMVRERNVEFPAVQIHLKTDKLGSVIELNPDTGEIFKADAQKVSDGWKINTSLTIVGSRLFIASSNKADVELQKQQAFDTIKRENISPDTWNMKLSEQNVLVLDRANYSIDGQAMDRDCYILKIDDKIRKYLKIPIRGEAMEQPWVRKDKLSKATADVELKLYFNCTTIPTGKLSLGIEHPELYTIYINNKKLCNKDACGWWCDKSLITLHLDPAMLVYGKNEIVLKCKYSEAYSGLESIFLLGDFACSIDKLDLNLSNLPEKLSIGDWCQQGLPFYSGSIFYSTQLDLRSFDTKKLFIELKEFRGSCAKISIDSQVVGTIAWAPYELDISELTNGKQECCLTIEIISSRRNSHGPMYQKETWPLWSGPYEFREYEPEYKLVPCGLMQCPIIKIKKGDNTGKI